MLALAPPSFHVVALTGFGLLIALVVWLPLVLRRLPLSLPIVCIAIGALLFSTVDVGFVPLPAAHLEIVEFGAEFVVLVALMGAGLKIDRVIGWRRWRVTWRLLGITMPLSIAVITGLGMAGLGLSLATALLLGAVLAPTDPVLAADIQVGPPRTGDEDDARFGLTAEAGLNDGLAFPFVALALTLLASGTADEAWFGDWVWHAVVWEIVGGTAVGVAIGWLFGWLSFRLPAGQHLARTGDGIIALAATFVAYGCAEMIDSYGFIAVFVAGLTLRHSHRDHDFQRDMYDLVEQVERLAMMALLLLFGGALVSGLLAPLGWREVGFAVAVLLIARPVAGLLGMVRSDVPRRERWILAIFGIRGVGSVYYLAYAVNHGTVPEADRLWAIVGLIILGSVLLHGFTVTPTMRALDRAKGRDPDAEEEPEPA